MTKPSLTLKEKIAKSKIATLKAADPKAPTKIVLGGRPAQKK